MAIVSQPGLTSVNEIQGCKVKVFREELAVLDDPMLPLVLMDDPWFVFQVIFFLTQPIVKQCRPDEHVRHKENPADPIFDKWCSYIARHRNAMVPRFPNETGLNRLAKDSTMESSIIRLEWMEWALTLDSTSPAIRTEYTPALAKLRALLNPG